MQIIQSKSNIVEKILRDREGRLVRARFAVYEVAGRVKARLIDFTYINTLKGAVLSLSGLIKEKASPIISVLKNYNQPTFLILNSIFYFGSKPRAPTF